MDLIVTLIKTEIQYDINSTVQLIGSRETADGGSPEQAFNFGSTDGKNERNMVDRFMEASVNDLISATARYLSESSDFSDNDLDIANVDSFDFLFDVPETFNKAYIRPLRSSMHEYVVNQTLFKWFLRTKQNEAVMYRELADDLIDEIKGYLHKRTGMLKIRPYPHI